MKLKMSFFDPTLLKKNIGRFSPAWAIWLMFLLLRGPLVLMTQIQNHSTRDQWFYARIENFLEEYDEIGFIFAALTAFCFVGLVLKYLHRTDSSYMIHAFPMTRNCLFLTNTVSGLLFYLIPVLLAALCQLGVLALYKLPGYETLVWSALGKNLLQFAFFYGLAVFCAVLSGNSGMALLSYSALNILFMVLPLMALATAKYYFQALYINVSDWLIYLAPIMAMAKTERADITLLIIYACIGLVLLGLAWLLYRYRHMERAGDAMAYGWARIVFRLIFTLCCALGLGLILSEIFYQSSLLFFVLLGCFIGWFGSSMINERTVKVFKLKQVWIGFTVFAALLTVALLGAKYDLLGVRTRIPQADTIKYVEIWSRYNNVREECPLILTKQEDVELIRGIHQNAIADDDRHYGIVEFDGIYYGEVCLSYHLQNGSIVRRLYRIKRQTDRDALDALCTRADLASDYYERFFALYLPKNITSVRLFDAEHDTSLDRTQNSSALREALLADAAAGDLPIEPLLSSAWEKYENEGYLQLECIFSNDDYDRWFTIFISASAKNTLALLGR